MGMGPSSKREHFSRSHTYGHLPAYHGDPAYSQAYGNNSSATLFGQAEVRLLHPSEGMAPLLSSVSPFVDLS